jgi:alpha-N-acetylglucosaminidase
MAFVMFLVLVLSLLLPSLVKAQAPLTGDVSAVYDLLDRVLPKRGSDHFHLTLGDCSRNHSNPQHCFRLQNSDDGRLIVTATTASELSAGIGYFLQNYCNMTIGWPRGGGSNIFIPEKWPAIGADPITKRRIVPWSYLMNVCTHSYSLAFYDWNQWEAFIDWMSLTGINLMLALTGQEEVQYKVFSRLGVADKDIRSWFNGPGFLAWSRGQNEYGSGICGPLPKSFMKAQWEMQRTRILPRLRSLGITGQLPAFQGNVPIQLKAILHDSNMTKDGDTGWMDSLDPWFGKIADLWMRILIEDFGTDHWYQMDGYFDGSTAPWRGDKRRTKEWKDHRKVKRDELAYRRGSAAYTGINRTDPSAVWSFQGWAIVGWSTPEQAGILKGFVDSAPKGKLVIIDMSRNGNGEWKQWQNSSFFGAPFVWTTLNNFGGTSGIKGDLSVVNRIPFDGPSSAIGTGATPEGIDQNPAYYDFVFEQNFRDSPVGNIRSYLINRSHRRYGLTNTNEKVAKAWSLLADGAYAEDLSTQDNTGVSHLHPYGGDDASMFERDRSTPKPVLCNMVEAWKLLIQAAESDPQCRGLNKEPFKFDLIDLGREVLAQISTPAVLNFSDATEQPVLNKDEIMKTGVFYTDVLSDIDKLVATDTAFLLGPFLESARRLGRPKNDCFSNILEDSDCGHFYEWNARTQITTWNPTRKNSDVIPGGPIDYASKHWSGLIRDYYVPRATLLMKQAIKDRTAGRSLNQTEVSRLHAQLAYKWTTDEKKYSVLPNGDAVSISRSMYEKYSPLFIKCEAERRNDVAESPVLVE